MKLGIYLHLPPLAKRLQQFILGLGKLKIYRLFRIICTIIPAGIYLLQVKKRLLPRMFGGAGCDIQLWFLLGDSSWKLNIPDQGKLFDKRLR